jgi:lysyl-tRNA synthetase class 2
MADIDPDAFNHIKQLTDVGDILGVKGTIKRTEKGELSVYVQQYTILTKSLLPLPDKWHGLTDTEKRYRQRYVDLIVNPEVRQTFRRRAQITAGIRRYLESLDFIEIETPVLQTEAGGADARPFITYHNTLDMELYLRLPQNFI